MLKTKEKEKSCIPKLSRSASLRYKGERKPQYHCSKHDLCSSIAESSEFDDLCSLRSFDSASIISYELNEHSHPKNDKKYVLHCQHNHQAPEQYLTPTQRKEKEIRQLRSLLKKATQHTKIKDEEINRLSSELEQLKMIINDNNEPQTNGNLDNINEEELQASSSDNTIQTPPIPQCHSEDKQQADSGIVEDESPDQSAPTLDRATFQKLLNLFYSASNSNQSSEEHFFPCGLNKSGYMSSLSSLNQPEEIKFQAEYQQLKEKYNNKLETLLQSLGEANARYMELQPLYERSQDKVRLMEAQIEVLKKELKTQEDWHSQMYLKMYKKGQEAAKFEHADEVLEFAHRAPKRVSVPELLQQLHKTEQELESTKDMYRSEVNHGKSKPDEVQPDYTLHFLKDAMFYFLTEKDNKEHLHAIQSILGFSELERQQVNKSMRYKRFLIP